MSGVKGPVSTALHLTRRAAESAVERLGHAVSRLRDRGTHGHHAVGVPFRGRSLAALPWRSAEMAFDATLTRCHDVLGESRLETVRRGWERPAIVVDDLPAVRATLRATPGLYLEGDRVFRAWESSGRFVAGPDVGVDLVASSPAPAFSAEIDLVFTWVDGTDPAWLERRGSRLGEEAAALHPSAANDARFVQIDELRFALRAVERFAPWRRRVFLVTDGQSPDWLADEFPHVTLVGHAQIFDDPEALPTFNSHAIESRLHHIPGLAEHWIYLNDDVFLGGYSPPSRFFDAEGRARVFLADEAIPDGPVTASDQPVVAAAKRNRELLARLTGGRLERKLKHVPHPQLRSVTEELERLAPAEFRSTGRSAFRHPDDLSVASSLAPHYALATGRAVPGRISHFYADVASPELRWRLPRLLEWRDAEVICLNATDAAPDANRARLVDFLGRYFS